MCVHSSLATTPNITPPLPLIALIVRLFSIPRWTSARSRTLWLHEVTQAVDASHHVQVEASIRASLEDSLYLRYNDNDDYDTEYTRIAWDILKFSRRNKVSNRSSIFHSLSFSWLIRSIRSPMCATSRRVVKRREEREESHAGASKS